MNFYQLSIFILAISLSSCVAKTSIKPMDNIEPKNAETVNQKSLIEHIEKIYKLSPKGIMTAETPITKEALIYHFSTQQKIVFANFKSGIDTPHFNYSDEAINYLIAQINESEQFTYEIVGHTHSLGSEASNYKLSENRANNVKALLIKHFHLESKQIKSVGEGEKNPIDTNKSEQGQSNNSRVEIKIN